MAALTQEWGCTAAIVTAELCPRYPSSTTTPMTTASLGEAITDAAAWWQGRLRAAGLDQTAINGIDATNEPVLYRNCRRAVKLKAAIVYMNAMAPTEMVLVEQWQRELDHMVVDLGNNATGFLAEIYARATHGRTKSHVLEIPITNAADQPRDDEGSTFRKGDTDGGTKW